MPPKWPRKRTQRTTARRSIPPPKTSAISPAPESPLTVDIPTQTATGPPPSSSPETIPLTSPEPIKTTNESFPIPTPLPSSPLNVTEKNIIVAEHVAAESAQPLMDIEAPEIAVKTLAVNDSAEKIGIQAENVRAKTVVKKTVKRIVKRIVKKKVPKIVKKEESIVSSNEEEVGNLGLSGMIERNPVIESVSLVENPKNVNEDEVEALGKSEIGEVEKGMCVNDIISDVVLPNCNGANSSVDGVEEGISVRVEDGSVGLTGSSKDEGDNEDAESSGCEGKTGVKEGTESGDECGDLVMDGELGDGALETENGNCCSVEGEGKGKGEVENGEIEGLRVESGVEPLGVGVVLSGEMEALERLRRRKTEIFVGGLDKETKEEDIRKVFELVGKIIDVRLVKDSKTGKCKGFAFVRYASAEDAKTALVKYHKVEISGKQCGTAPVEGNDTIFLGNINKKWKSEDVRRRLQEIGIEKIDKVTVVADPNNLELNRGFAFLELETKKDAQTAFSKLQKKDVFGKHLKIKVAWAEPLIEPDQEEMRKVKSVYAEYIPSSWNEEKVKEYFKCFGEIENVTLARNLRSSKRKDFAFVNYKTREAALACIEAFSRDQFYDEGSKVNMKVSLAKPLARGKQVKHASKPSSMEIPKERRKAALVVLEPNELRNMGKSTSRRYEDTRAFGKSSTTDELVQLLRAQASWMQTGTSSSIGTGSVDHDYLQPPPGLKRPVAVLGNDSFHPNPRGYPRMRLESSYSIANSRPFPQGVGMTSAPEYNRHAANYTAGPFYRVEEHPSYSQTRERAPYHGSAGIYRRN